MVRIFSIGDGAFLNQIQHSETQLNKFLSENWEYFFPQYTYIKSEFSLDGNVRSKGGGGRIDILAFNTKTNKFVVFELKRNLARNIRDQAGDYRDNVISNFHIIYLLCTDDYGIELPKYKTVVQDSIEIVLVSNSFSPADVEKVNNFKNDEITLIKYCWFENQLLLIEYLNNAPTEQIKKVPSFNSEISLSNISHKQFANPMANEILKIKNKKGVDASGYIQLDGQFKVLANSTVSKNIRQKSTPRNAIEERDSCEKNGIIKDGKFIVDHTFNSISLAAEVVLGGSLNGNRTWKKG